MGFFLLLLSDVTSLLGYSNFTILAVDCTTADQNNTPVKAILIFNRDSIFQCHHEIHILKIPVTVHYRVCRVNYSFFTASYNKFTTRALTDGPRTETTDSVNHL